MFYRVPDAARLIGTAPVTLYRAIRRGDFPAMRVGNRVVVPARAIEELIDATVAEGVVDTSGWALVRK